MKINNPVSFENLLLLEQIKAKKGLIFQDTSREKTTSTAMPHYVPGGPYCKISHGAITASGGEPRKRQKMAAITQKSILGHNFVTRHDIIMKVVSKYMFLRMS